MRLLHEIVREEIGKAYPIDMVGVQHEALQKRNRTMRRLQDDVALASLVSFIENIITGASLTPFGTEMKREMYAQTIVDAIVIWENANNSFNNQIFPPKS